MPTDEQLARQAVDGDEAAFGELIRRHQKTVYRLAMRMLGNSEDADDVTQESFVRAFRYLRSFRVDRRFGA